MESRKNMKEKKSKGFTLFELLGTIIILGIIASITTAVVLNANKEAEKQSVLITDQSLKIAARDLVNEILIPNNYEWYIDPEDETREYICFTAQALVNYGYLEKKQVKDPNQLIRVTRDKNTFVFINEMIVNNDFDCAGGFPYVVYTINGTKGNLYNKVQWYTSDVVINVVPKPEVIIESYFYRLNGTTSNKINGATPTNVNINTNGKHTLYTEITGKFLNSNDERNPNRDKMSITVNIDKVVPNVIVKTSDNINSNDWHENGFKFNLSSNEKPISGITYYYSTTDKNVDVTKATALNGTSLTIENKNTSLEGTKYYFKACSNAGLCGNVVEYIVRIDNTFLPAPTITPSDGIRSGVWHTKNFQLTIDYSSCENPYGCQLRYQAGSKPTFTTGYKYSQPLNAATDTKSRTIYAVVCTNGGRCGPSTSYTIKLDTKPPTVPRFSLGNAISISGSTDNLTSVTYYHKIANASKYTSGSSISYSKIGRINQGTTVYAYAKDEAGNKSSVTNANYKSIEADYGTVSSTKYYTCSLNNNEYTSQSAAKRDCEKEERYTGTRKYYCPHNDRYYSSNITCSYDLAPTKQSWQFKCNGLKWYDYKCLTGCGSNKQCESGYEKEWRMTTHTCQKYVSMDDKGRMTYKSCKSSEKNLIRTCSRTFKGTCTKRSEPVYYCSKTQEYQKSSTCYYTKRGTVDYDYKYYCSKTGRYYSSRNAAESACRGTCPSNYTLTSVDGYQLCRRLS